MDEEAATDGDRSTEAGASRAASAAGREPLRSVWPAYLCAAGLLTYAAMKASYAVQGKLGLPFGPEVPRSAYEELGHVALRQWALAGLGAGAALIALASVQAWGRRVPRWLLLTVMWTALVPLAAGAPFVVHRIITGSPPLGERLLVGAQSIGGLALWATATLSYQRRSRRRAQGSRR